MRYAYVTMTVLLLGLVACGDNVLPPECGDGNVDVDEAEQCDDGNLIDGDGCQATCLLPACGDGVLDDGEACDDGNNVDGDGTCQAACTIPTCGDGVADPEEDCDDGGESATCNATCTAAACGDGEVNAAAGETCDDGGETPTCNVNCTAAACGDGTVNTAAGEDCDDGGESAACDPDCTNVECGDSYINSAAGEVCDDSNSDDLDGCSANCMSDETCGNLYLDVVLGETCDDSNMDAGDGCDACVAEPIQVCAGDVPVDIDDNATMTSAITTFPYLIESLDVELDVSHTRLADLDINLVHGPTSVLIADNFYTGFPGNPCIGDDMQVILDDEANDTLELACVEPGPPSISGRVSPAGNLSDFVGMDAGGDWVLEVTDDAAGQVGSVDRWCLNLNGFGVQNTGVYWINTGGSLWRADSDGMNPAEIATTPGSFVVATDPASGQVYYDSNGSEIVRVDADGSNPTTVVNTGNNIFGLDIDSVNGKIYWSEFNLNQIWRSDLDGSNQETIVTGVTSPSGITVDPVNGKVYFITYNTTTLYSANLDGTGQTTVMGGLPGQGVGVAVDPSTQIVYYSTRGNDIYSINADGTGLTTLVTGQGAVQGLAIDIATGKLYWTAVLAGLIRRADYADGGNIEDVTPTNGNAWGVAILPGQ